MTARDVLTPGAIELIEVAQMCHQDAGHGGPALDCREGWCAENTADLLMIVRAELLLAALDGQAQQEGLI